MKRPLLLAFGALWLTACGDVGHHASPLELMRHEEPSASRAVEQPEHTVPVQGLRDINSFFVGDRTGKLDKFPCQQCHKVPLDRIKHDGRDGKTRAHWAITLKHAPDAVMNCKTCHLENDLNQLRTLNNQPVSIDHAYQVCGQCHSKQLQDWAGGAHGKRSTGWGAARVAKSCVECHNPHDPNFEHSRRRNAAWN
jgi:hypothetical protein